MHDESVRIRGDQSESGTGLQDWIGRRLRNRGSTNQRAQSHSEASNQMNSTAANQKVQTLPALNSGCTYVGNTLLKQKPRLRVRQSANQKPDNIIFPSANQEADNTSQDTLSIEDRILDYDPRRGRSNSCSRSGASGPRGGTSGSELSDMEQVLFRAARLRSRRVRSASNETRGTDRTSQLDNYSLTQTVTGSAGGSAGFDDSDSHPGDDDSFLIYGSCAKTYNERIKEVAANQKTEIIQNQTEANPELVSLSTEYDPNFSTSSESGAPTSGNSSGYGGSAGSSSGYNSSDQNQPIRDRQKSDLAKKLLADKVIENIPTNEVIVNRVDTFEPLKTQESFRQKSKLGQKSEENPGNDQTAEQNDKSDKPSLFYVALVGNDKKIKNANYRVRSGYTGPTMKNGQLGIGEYEHNEIRKSNSMSEVRESRMSGGYCEGVIDATYCSKDRQDWKSSDRPQLEPSPAGSNDPERSGSHRTRLQRGTPMRGSLPANFNRSQPASNDPVALHDPGRSHDVSRKNSLGSSQTRRGSSGSNTSFTIKPDNVKVTPTNKDEWKITIKISREKDESDDYRTTSEAESVPGRHTIIREARIKKKIQKENQTQTSPQATRATSPKSPDTDSEPCMVPHIRQMPQKSGYIPQNMTHTPMTHTPMTNSPMTNSPMTQPLRPDQVATGEGRSGLKMLRTEFAKSGPGGRKDVLPDMPRRCYLTRTQVTSGHVTSNNLTPTSMTQGQKPKKEGFKSILNKWEDRCHLSRAASVDGLNQPIRSGTFSGTSSRRTSQQSNQSDFRTGMSNAGSDRTSNGPNFGEFQMMNNSSTTSGIVSPTSGDNFRSGEEDEPNNQETKKLPPLDSGPIFTRNRAGFQRSSSLQRFGSENSLGNRYNRFDQVGDMGRYSYRPGPIGWKASNY